MLPIIGNVLILILAPYLAVLLYPGQIKGIFKVIVTSGA